MAYYTYIMASRPLGATYVGSTNNLRLRVEEHRAGTGSPHTARYGINRLVWFETHGSFAEAATREKRIKGWRRQWKDQLIMDANPDWQDITWQVPQ